MFRIPALAFVLALGACAAPTALSHSKDFSREPLPPGLRHAHCFAFSLGFVGGPDGTEQWQVQLQVKEPFIAIDGVRSENLNEANACIQQLIATLNMEWESDAPPSTAEAI